MNTLSNDIMYVLFWLLKKVDNIFDRRERMALAFGFIPWYSVIAFISWELWWASFVTIDARLGFTAFVIVGLIFSWVAWEVLDKEC